MVGIEHLGYEVRCEATGAVGFVNQYYEKRFGSPMVELVIGINKDNDVKTITTEAFYCTPLQKKVTPKDPEAPCRFEMGQKVRDRISKFEGEINGIATFVSGCRHLVLVPNALHDKKPVDAVWFSEGTLEAIGKPPKEKIPTTGGPAKASSVRMMR